MTVELGVLVDRYQEQIDETYGYIDDCLTVWDRRKAIGEQGFPVLETSSLERIYESALVSAVWFPRNRGGLLYAASGSVTAVFS